MLSEILAITAPQSDFRLSGQTGISLSKKIYVGNLPFSSTEADLKDVFERHGGVESVAVITDRETGRPRGFAFVEMEDENAAQEAIRALDGTDLGGRNIRVNEAQDKNRGPRRY
jgi:RNA recognition motif-containing protein